MTDNALPAAAAPPLDFRALRELIVRRRDGLPKRLRQVADFSVAQPQEIAFRTVRTSPPPPASSHRHWCGSRRRWATMGFPTCGGVPLARPGSVAGLRRAAAGAATGRADGAGDGPAALLQDFVRASEVSLERLRGATDPEALALAVHTLAVAESILPAASRRSFPVTAYLAYAMRRLGIRCDPADWAGGLAQEQVALLRPGDAMLAISFTPYAAATVELTNAASRRGVKVVAITDSPFSPLIQPASVWLEVAEADHLGFRSLAGSFALATTLAVGVARQRSADRTKIPN